MADEKLCQCGRHSKASFKVCSHIASGEVKDIQIKENRATCEACAKLIPDESFADLCMRCIDKLQGPENPEQDLEGILAEEAKDLAFLEKLKARIDERNVQKRELQRRLAADLLEQLVAEFHKFLAEFQEGGTIHKAYSSLQELTNRLSECDAEWPRSISTKVYSTILDRQLPTVAYLADQLSNGNFGDDVSLAQCLSRIFKNKSDINPFWKEAGDK